MTHHAHLPRRLRRTLVAAALVATAALGLVACASVGGAIDVPTRVPTLASSSSSAGGIDSVADGYIADNAPVSAFDESVPAVANLDTELRAAVQDASTAAAADGLELALSSGWRSAAYQQSLLDDAVRTYGSLDEARRWVNTPALSSHVTGDAVDIGPLDAQFWLMEHGSAFGLCQTYANERWHFELATKPGCSCPVQRGDAAG